MEEANKEQYENKDPAFLFYSSDFLTGTMFMSDVQLGKYIKLLCVQHQKGHLSEKDMLNICKRYDKDIFEKFGLLDEVFKSCFEDVDLNFKLYKNGYVNILNPNAICTHYESLTRKNTVDNDDLMCMFQRVLKDEKIYNYFINKNKENKQK